MTSSFRKEIRAMPPIFIPNSQRIGPLMFRTELQLNTLLECWHILAV